MAISGSGGWIPSAKVYIYRRQMQMQYPFHNVYPSQVWHPEHAAAYFLDRADEGRGGPGIYVPLAEWGGCYYLADLLVEVGLIDPYRPDDIEELAQAWPTLDGVEEGIDIFADRYGAPTGE